MQNAQPEYESARKFAKRTGLPENVVRYHAKAGHLPIIQSGKRNLYIHITGAVEALAKIAYIEAKQKEMCSTAPKILPIKVPEKVYKGRPPDAVRLGRLPR